MHSSYHVFKESLQNLRAYKLRSLLTGFGVVWGIFILVILLSVGEGFYNGVFEKFKGYAHNVLWCWGRESQEGERIRFSLSALRSLERSVPDVQYAVPVVNFGRSNAMYSQYGTRFYGDLKGTQAYYQQAGLLEIVKGRFLNSRDEALARTVCVIGHQLCEALFGDRDPIGEIVTVEGVCFRVVGVFDKDALGNRDVHSSLVTPIQTLSNTTNPGVQDHFGHFQASMRSDARDPEQVEQAVRAHLASQLGFKSTDKEAVHFFNLSQRMQSFHSLFHSIRVFLWGVGLCILLSGVVGVGNMMLVVVKERTPEIAIRKVLGASTRDILGMILAEAVCISVLSGIIGMSMGYVCIALGNTLLEHIDPKQELLLGHLEFKPSAAVAALAILTSAGVLAGILPARRATAILPIKALNSE